MNNVFDRDFKQKELSKPPIHSSDLLPGIIEGRHLESNMFAVFFGLSADRPDGTTHCKAYFATDTGVLSMWNGTAWITTTLS